MATHEISLLGPSTVPDTSGNCWQEPYTIAATNDVWALLVYRFKDSGTKVGVYGQFTVPQNYVGTAAVKPVWTATATTGNIVWQFEYRTVGGDDTTSLDQAGTEETPNVTDAAPTAAHRRLQPTISPTSANFAAGETVEYYFVRDGSVVGDTLAADGLLFDLLLSYSDA